MTSVYFGEMFEQKPPPQKKKNPLNKKGGVRFKRSRNRKPKMVVVDTFFGGLFGEDAQVKMPAADVMASPFEEKKQFAVPPPKPDYSHWAYKQNIPNPYTDHHNPKFNPSVAQWTTKAKAPKAENTTKAKAPKAPKAENTISMAPFNTVSEAVEGLRLLGVSSMTKLLRVVEERKEAEEAKVEAAKEQTTESKHTTSESKQSPDTSVPAAAATPTLKWAKGTGYGHSGLSDWNATDYIKRLEQEAKTATAVWTELAKFMASESLTLSPADVEALELSALIPALVQELRSSSLLEMSKREPCAMAMFKVIRALAARSETHSLLLKPTPAGKESCIKNSLKTVSLDAKAITKFDKADVLAGFIMETCNSVAKISKETSLAVLPPPGLGERKVSKQDGFKNYTRLLEPHRFGMFDGGFPAHKYLSNASTQNGTTDMKLLKRLQKEYVGLQTSLPVHPDASIFVRVDESQMTLAQICITPANGPYARGAFIFDVYFPPQYPSVPMKCNLATTGKNTFRFNPNLYQCGKVCLSLLGTWGGQGAENWDPRYSTLLQLCVSIMAQIFIEEPYFNEPGYESSRGTPHGTSQSTSYNNRVRVATVKFAMIDQLENPPKGFEYPVLTHFYLMKEAILEQVNGWLVDGKSLGAELDELKSLVPKLTTLLKELEMPEPPADEEDSDSESDDDDVKEENTEKEENTVAMEIVD